MSAWWGEWIQQWKQMVRLGHTGLLLCPYSVVSHVKQAFFIGWPFGNSVHQQCIAEFNSLQVIHLHSSRLCFVMPSLHTGHSQNSSAAYTVHLFRQQEDLEIQELGQAISDVWKTQNSRTAEAAEQVKIGSLKQQYGSWLYMPRRLQH